MAFFFLRAYSVQFSSGLNCNCGVDGIRGFAFGPVAEVSSPLPTSGSSLFSLGCSVTAFVRLAQGRSDFESMKLFL